MSYLARITAALAALACVVAARATADAYQMPQLHAWSPAQHEVAMRWSGLSGSWVAIFQNGHDTVNRNSGSAERYVGDLEIDRVKVCGTTDPQVCTPTVVVTMNEANR